MNEQSPTGHVSAVTIQFEFVSVSSCATTARCQGTVGGLWCLFGFSRTEVSIVIIEGR